MPPAVDPAQPPRGPAAGDRRYRGGDYREESPEFAVEEDFAQPSRDKVEVKRKVDGSEKHENGACPVDRRTPEVADAVVVGREAARPHCGEGVAHGVEPRHSKMAQQQRLREGKEEIDRPERLCGSRDAGSQLALLRAGCLGLDHAESALAEKRYQGNGQRDHAHAAEPVRLATPKIHALGKRLDISHDRGAGRGKSAYALEDRVGHATGSAAQIEGQRPEKADHDPDSANHQKGVLDAYRLDAAFPFPAEGDGANPARRHRDAERQRRALFAVMAPYRKRKEQSRAYDAQHVGENAYRREGHGSRPCRRSHGGCVCPSTA